MAKPIDAILAASQPEQMMTINPTLSTNQVQPEPEVINVNEQKVMADNIANMDLIREATQKGIDVPTLLAQKEAEGAVIAQQPSAYDTMVQDTQNMSPAPQQSMPSMEPQVSVQQPKPQAVVMPQESIAPDPVAVSAKVAQRKEQMEDQIANEVATESTAKQIENQVQAETQQALDKVDNEIKSIGPQQLGDYFNQGTMWQKLLAGVALGLGGFYAGYSGRENPALQILTKAVEGNRELRKLKQDERNKIIAAQADLLAQRLKSFESDPNRNPMARMKMQEARLALEKTSTEIRKNLADIELTNAKARAESGGVANIGKVYDSIAMLPESQREYAVVLPDGRVGLAASKAKAAEFDKFQADVVPAINGVDRVNKLIQDFNRVTDLKRRGQIQTELQALVGQLRLPFVGPGAMTDKEYDRLKDTIGSPTKLAAFPSVERAKLLQVKKKLQADYNTRLEQTGIRIPPNRPAFTPDQEQRIESLTRATIEKAKREGKKVPSEKSIRQAYERYFQSEQE